MSLMVASKLSKFFGAEEIFSDVTVEIPKKARIAIVGPNGAGKTTLINILAGLELPTEGEVTKAKNAKVAYLPQRPELVGDHTLWEEQLRAFDQLREMEAQLAKLETEMTDPKHYDRALAEYGPLQAEFDHLGGYNYETKIRMVLNGVGFDEDEHHMSLALLSGGQKTRALLARLLLEEPDILILDEPTNHLDIHAVEWLEDYLKDFSGAVVSVSHDRYFIDNFANIVWEMEFHRVETYRGNYTHYLQQRDERRERLLKEFESQQEFIQKEMDYIRKHMGSRWTAQAKGRLKKLQTMKKRGLIIERGPQHRKKMHLKMETAQRSGNKVLMTKALAVGYEPESPLFYAPDMTLWRGETAAIIGGNGTGKSTFLKTVIGELAPLMGEAVQGASVKVGYFAQAHELLNGSNSILDEIIEVKDMPISEARNYLGKFLFSGDDVFRRIDTLSGGERGRVALAKLSLGGSNLLLLDEPTNHLDIDSQEILQAVLNGFDGTILLVSHDRYLIDALATQIWAVSPGEMSVFEGTYEEYVAARNQQRLNEEAAANANGKSAKQTNFSEKKHGLTPYQLKQRVMELEAEIEQLEIKLQDLTNTIAEVSSSGDADKVAKLGEAYSQAESDLEAAMSEWELLAE